MVSPGNRTQIIKKGTILNILILSQMFPDRQDPVNGIFVLDQTRELQKQGHQIMVIRLVPYVPPGFGFLKRKWKHYREIPSQDCLGDITVHYIRSFFLPRGILLSWTARVAYRVIKRFLNQIHPQFEFDVIHAHAILPDGYVGGLLRRAFRRPLISTIHGTDLQQRIHQSRLWRNAIHYALLQTDQIVLVSHKLRHILEETFPDIDKSKISVIHNGIDPEKTRMSQKTEIKQEFSNRILLLSVGNLIPIKGHLYVLQAVADLKIEFPTIAYCIIGDGPERSTLENAVKHLSLQSHVSFTGFQPPHVVADYMAACDIFVLPSYNEGFGIVYIEAMSFGKPVIACRGQGIEDCITHQVNGFLVNPQDSNDLKETIRYILLHPDHTGRITKQAQDDILNNWTWAVNICHYQSLYQKLEPLTPTQQHV